MKTILIMTALAFSLTACDMFSKKAQLDALKYTEKIISDEIEVRKKEIKDEKAQENVKSAEIKEVRKRDSKRSKPAKIRSTEEISEVRVKKKDYQD